MTWLWISAIVILIGAELDAGMEHQTMRDTTTGSPKPMGKRGCRNGRYGWTSTQRLTCFKLSAG